MKKLIAALVAAGLVLPLAVGCGDQPSATVKDKEKATVKEGKAEVKEKEKAMNPKDAPAKDAPAKDAPPAPPKDEKK